MKLYGALASPFVARVVMAARLKNLPLELAFPPGGLKSPEFQQLSPLGKIPALEHDGRCLVESGVILEYLEDVAPTPALLPREPYARAQVRTVARAVDLYLSPHVSTLLRQAPGAAGAASAVDGFRQGLTALEAFLVPGPWAVGASPSLADCTLLPTLQLATARVVPVHGLGDALGAAPKLAAWWAFVQQEPRCAALIAEIDVAMREFLARMAAQRAAAGG